MILSKKEFESKLPKDFGVTMLNGATVYHKDGKHFGAFDKNKQIGIIDHAHKGSGFDLLDKLKTESYLSKTADQSIQEAYIGMVTEAITVADTGPTYTVKPGNHQDEGKIHQLDMDASEVETALGMDKGSLDNKEKYGQSHIITGSDGSKHTIYSSHGVARIRPVGKTTDKHTSDLKKFIGVDEA